MQNLLTVRDWIRWGSSQFYANDVYFGHGTDNAWDEAALLVLWAIHQPWSNLERVIDTRLTPKESEKVESLLLERVQKRVPAAYLTGEAWFGGLKFKVTPDVLVPRSPFAELILQGFQPWLSEPPEQVLDLCTGSGCIGILCAKVFECGVDLADISPAALAVARENIAQQQLEQSVQVYESDVFDGLAGKKYDLIVTNPPYVDAEDLASMPAEYQAEPVLGLEAGGDGLDIARRILRSAAAHLNENGLLAVEVGNSCIALEAAFPDVPFLWPELENGGHGIFLLTAEQLKACSFE